METSRDELAAKHFPKEWAAVATKTGASKKRQQFRQRAEHAEIYDFLRSAGASCRSCNGFSRSPFHAGTTAKYICELDSDFYGSVEAKAGGLCHRWSEKRI